MNRFSSPRAAVTSLLILLLLLTAGCGGDAVPTTPDVQTGPTSPPKAQATLTKDNQAVVFAAASLRESFADLEKALVGSAGVQKVTYNFAGSQTLATQLGQGAQADVFASADERSMSAAIASGAVVSGTQRVLVTNKLTVVVSLGASARVSNLADLAKPGVKVVLAGETVPAGRYALQALDKLAADPTYGGAYKDSVLKNVVSRETDVRQVLAKVQLGEADAGIVYVTDARTLAGGVASTSTSTSTPSISSIPMPDQYNMAALYYIAPTKDAPHPVAAKRFVDYVLSGEGQALMMRYGFGRAEQGK